MRLTIMTVILLQCDNDENERGRGVNVLDDLTMRMRMKPMTPMLTKRTTTMLRMM